LLTINAATQTDSLFFQTIDNDTLWSLSTGTTHLTAAKHHRAWQWCLEFSKVMPPEWSRRWIFLHEIYFGGTATSYIYIEQN
jgi:hypothetical protein